MENTEYPEVVFCWMRVISFIDGVEMPVFPSNTGGYFVSAASLLTEDGASDRSSNDASADSEVARFTSLGVGSGPYHIHGRVSGQDGGRPGDVDNGAPLLGHRSGDGEEGGDGTGAGGRVGDEGVGDDPVLFTPRPRTITRWSGTQSSRLGDTNDGDLSGQRRYGFNSPIARNLFDESFVGLGFGNGVVGGSGETVASHGDSIGSRTSFGEPVHPPVIVTRSREGEEQAWTGSDGDPRDIEISSVELEDALVQEFVEYVGHGSYLRALDALLAAKPCLDIHDETVPCQLVYWHYDSWYTGGGLYVPHQCVIHDRYGNALYCACFRGSGQRHM